MKTFSTRCDRAGFAEALAKARDIAPQITLVFGAPIFFSDKDGFDKASAGGAMNVMGCATAEQISPEGVSRDSCSILAMHFDAAEVKIADGAVPQSQPRAAGQEFGRKLAAPDLVHVFLLLPAVAGAAEFTRGVSDTVPQQAIITGGIAGDGGQVMFNGRVYPDRAVAFALYGDKAAVTCGAASGWKSFGPVRRATRTGGNILLELDGKPAAAVYAQYIRDKSAVHPYPLSILRDDGRTDSGAIRSVVAIDEITGGLTLAGDVPQNAFLRLMHADADSLAAAEKGAVPAMAPDAVSLVVASAMRRAVAGSDAHDEIGAVTGFFGQGEIVPVGGAPELNNGTFTVTTITEKM